MFSRVQAGVKGQNPRKRQKRSHEPEADLLPRPNFAMPSTAGPSNTKPAPAGDEMCHHEQALRRLEPDLEAMRQLITCKMCYCFLTEPYSLACGHTYCYICLDSWLVAQKKRTCPDCRAPVKQQPNPSFVVREMTMIFSSRAELLPDGETLNEHEKYAKEAAEKVARDKANGRGDDSGLFRGIFSHRIHLRPMHDPTDGVDRCPRCNWELEGNVCSGCGARTDDDHVVFWSGDSPDESEEEVDLDELDEMDEMGAEIDADIETGYDSESSEAPNIDHDIFGAFPSVRPPVLGAGSRRSRRPIVLDDESDEESSEDDDEHDPQMDSFIDDEAGESGSESSESGDEDEEAEAQSTPHPRLHRRAPILIDSDDEQSVTTHANPMYIDSDSDDDDSQIGAGHGGRSNMWLQEIPNHLDMSDDSDNGSSSDGLHDDEPEDEEHPDFGATPSFASSDDAGAIEAAGFSPVSHDTEVDQAFEGGYPVPYEQFDDTNEHDDEERESSATAGYDTDNLSVENGYDYDGDEQQDDDDNDDEDSDGTAGSAPLPPHGPSIKTLQTDTTAGIRATTPADPRPVEVAQTHRLSTRTRHRPRSQPRLVPVHEHRGGALASDDENLATPGAVLRAAREARPVAGMSHPFQLSDTLARVNDQQRRVREGGSRRGASRRTRTIEC